MTGSKKQGPSQCNIRCQGRESVLSTRFWTRKYNALRGLKRRPDDPWCIALLPQGDAPWMVVVSDAHVERKCTVGLSRNFLGSSRSHCREANQAVETILWAPACFRMSQAQYGIYQDVTSPFKRYHSIVGHVGRRKTKARAHLAAISALSRSAT